MPIEVLDDGRVHLTCDAVSAAGRRCDSSLSRHDVSEAAVLHEAGGRGWEIHRDLGLYYCPSPWHTIQACRVCGAVAMHPITPVDREIRWYCGEHYGPAWAAAVDGE